MSDTDIYEEAKRRLRKFGERPARERFKHSVEAGLINEDGTLGPRLRDVLKPVVPTAVTQTK